LIWKDLKLIREESKFKDRKEELRAQLEEVVVVQLMVTEARLMIKQKLLHRISIKELVITI
jgi:hypothetical protein